MSPRPYVGNGHGLPSRRPLVSVVTPFYNTADYLEECIESILDQSYEHWEYILADNCSTDDSGSIAQRFAARDPRIRFIREKDFVGQVENYNRALRYISPESKYCKIVQADDWIYPRCLEEMVAAAEAGPNVGLVSSFSLYGSDVGHGGLPIDAGPVYPGRDAVRATLADNRALFGSPTCVMYLSDFVRGHDPFFSVSSDYYEDAEVCFFILKEHDFGFVPQVLTFNRRDNDSIWTRLEQYGPRLLHRLLFLYKFGPDFMDSEELFLLISETERTYYDFLAREALRGYHKDFWEFHVRGLSTAGKQLSRRRVAGRCVLVLADAVVTPKRILAFFWRRLRKSGSSS